MRNIIINNLYLKCIIFKIFLIFKYIYFIGKHCEINGVRTLFVLFFWDIIYENSQTDVYHSQFQQQPLDISTNEFYEKRKHEIDERLKLMENWTLTEVFI